VFSQDCEEASFSLNHVWGVFNGVDHGNDREAEDRSIGLIAGSGEMPEELDGQRGYIVKVKDPVAMAENEAELMCSGALSADVGGERYCCGNWIVAVGGPSLQDIGDRIVGTGEVVEMFVAQHV
jgi:hypothetical protein